MNHRSTIAVALVLLTTLLVSGCGYKLSGANSFLPEHIKVIAVLPFDNRTGRPEIEQRVTEQVALELSKRGRYQVATDPSAADAVLDGAVLTYRSTPVQFNTEGRTTRLEGVVSIQATLRETANDQVLWSQTGLIFKEQYNVPEVGTFFAQETIAIEGIAEGVANALVTSILEGF